MYHNMYSQFYRSKVFIHKKEEGLIAYSLELSAQCLLYYYAFAGYGLRCHRVIKSICQLLGIRNLHCKVEASTSNVQNVTKAFFNAVINQVSQLFFSMIAHSIWF